MPNSEIERLTAQIQCTTARQTELKAEIHKLRTAIKLAEMLYRKRWGIEIYEFELAWLSSRIGRPPGERDRPVQNCEDGIALVERRLGYLESVCLANTKDLAVLASPDKLRTRLKYEIAGKLHMSPNDPDPVKQSELQKRLELALAPTVGQYGSASELMQLIEEKRKVLPAEIVERTTLVKHLGVYFYVKEELAKLQSASPPAFTASDVYNEELLNGLIDSAEETIENKEYHLKVTNSDLAQWTHTLAQLTCPRINSSGGSGMTGVLDPENDTGPG